MENKISVVSTTCRDCLFAEYDDNTQVGCHLGKIDKIKSHPVYELIEAMDDNKDFYVLNYHLCLHQRIKGWPHDDKSIEEMIKAVKEEVKMNWGAILVLNDEPLNDMSRVQKRLEEILDQSRPPSWIGIVNQDVDLDVYWIIDYLNEKDVKWKIESGGGDVRKHVDTLFNKFKKHKFVFYSIFESDKDIPSSLYTDMHNFVIDNLGQYSVIKEEDSMHGMIVNKVAHIKYEGNKDEPLETKIKKKSSIDLLLDYKDLI